MKKITKLGASASAAAVLLAANTGQAQLTSVNLSLNSNYGNWSEGGFAATLTIPSLANTAGFGPGGVDSSIIVGGDAIGIYQFTPSAVVTGNSPTVTVPNPFFAVCISPQGNLTYGTYTYSGIDASSAPAQKGAYSWPGGGGTQTPTQGAYSTGGLNNALYLFSTLSSYVDAGGAANGGGTAGSTQEKGAALALAMYTALYNSVGNGATINASGPFQITAGLTGNVLTDYNADLGQLKNFASQTGYILNPTTDLNANGSLNNNGQDMELLTSSGNVLGVPETSTYVSAALLMLPFGASALRIVRRNRKA